MNPFETSVEAAHNGGLSFLAWTVLAVTVITLVLTIIVLAMHRERLSAPFGKWWLLMIFFVLSPLAYLLNFSSAIEDSKTVDFCNSCHVMNGYVNDLRDPDSEYLASEHYQSRWISEDQCFTCHSDYGLFGNVKAKFSGIRHVWKYYTGYETPVKIYGTYNNGICLRCHAPTPGFQEEEKHEKNAADILSSKMSCLGIDCHVRPHPEEAWKVE